MTPDQRDRQDQADAIIRRLRSRFFEVSPPDTPVAIMFNELLKMNGTYTTDHAANAAREEYAKTAVWQLAPPGTRL